MNVIPFIDIMLVLLAVVLTTATFVAQGKIPIRLPGASAAQPLSPAERIEITVSRTGEYLVADRAVAIGQLDETIAGLDRQAAVLLRVDQDTAFAHFVRVVDLLKREGHANVSIQTRRVQP
jgi:biopolymer transport protein ExbD